MAGSSTSNHHIKVQYPVEGLFDATSLRWEVVQDPHSKYNALQVAYIPWARMEDFINGESAKEDWSTRFNVHWRRSKQENALKRPSADSYLTQIGFWCAFGPDDFRGEILEPTSKRRGEAGKHKSGCQCHFTVSQLYLWPHVGRINFIEWNHVDMDDNICHGKLYCGPEKRLKLAPGLSTKMKGWIFNMLLKGFTPQQVLAQHIGMAEKNMMAGSLHKTRDLFLTMRDVLNIVCKMENVTLHTSRDDATSVHNWVNDNVPHVFFYQPMNSSNHTPFALGIQSRWQLETICKYGHNGLLAMDATFGTNKYKFHLYSVLVFDAFRNGVPVAWVITSSSTRVNISSWLTSLRNRVLDHCKGWEPNAWMVDDAEAEILSLREVFGLPVLLCIWHVRRAWLKNLVKKLRDPTVRAAMFRHLGMIMNMQGKPGMSSCGRVEEAHKLLDQFFVDYACEEEFIAYFKRQWLPCIGMWIRASRTMQVANQDTNGSIESYHGLLKSKFLSDRRTIHGRRIDWLIKGLVSHCHAYYWYQDTLKEAGFKRNFRIMDVVKNSVARALEIPDDHVGFYDDDARNARVFSMSTQLHFYVVRNADVEWATCNCDWALRGNLCKHQVKVMMMVGFKVETILHKGVDMYDASVIDGGTPFCAIDKGLQDGSTKQGHFQVRADCNNLSPPPPSLAPSLVQHTYVEDNVIELTTCVQSEILAGCKNLSSPPPPPTPTSLVFDIQNLVTQSLQLAGEDISSLQHVQRSALQMLASLQAYKACQTSIPSHPTEPLTCLEDGYGNSLARAKPFIESFMNKKRSKRLKLPKDVGEGMDVDVEPFPRLPCRKRVTLQGILEHQMRADDSD
ncbi:hypothetical protein L7F22_067582 [Adiantum nelumboides]|nr:hypothetical protein [Adiantum nelumboides]